MARCTLLLFPLVISGIVHCDNEGKVPPKTLQVLVGEPLQFPHKCPPEKLVKVCRDVGQGSTRVVAEREGGVWRPAEGYKDRVNQNSTFALSTTFYTDTGLYEWECDGKVLTIDVFVAQYFSVPLTEGQAGKLPCFFSHAKLSDADSVQWKKENVTVLELNLATRNITFENGFGEKGVSLHNGTKDGEWSLNFSKLQMEDGGDYFCCLLKNGRKGRADERTAVRMKVIKKGEPGPCGPTTDGQSSTETEYSTTFFIIAVVVLAVVVVVLAAIILYKSGSCQNCQGGSQSPGPGGEQPSDEVQRALLNDASSPSANGVDVATGVVQNESSFHEETSV